jgi:hypothetical protein
MLISLIDRSFPCATSNLVPVSPTFQMHQVKRSLKQIGFSYDMRYPFTEKKRAVPAELWVFSGCTGC